MKSDTFIIILTIVGMLIFACLNMLFCVCFGIPFVFSIVMALLISVVFGLVVIEINHRREVDKLLKKYNLTRETKLK